jgi:hypothetical protein
MKFWVLLFSAFIGSAILFVISILAGLGLSNLGYVWTFVIIFVILLLLHLLEYYCRYKEPNAVADS